MKLLSLFILVLIALSVDARGGGTTNGAEEANVPLTHFQRARRHAPIYDAGSSEPQLSRSVANEPPPPPPKFRSRRNVMEVANEPPPPPKQLRARRQAPPGMPPPPEGMPPPPEGMPGPPMLW